MFKFITTLFSTGAKKNIRNRVMEVVEQKIEAAQARHDSEAERLTSDYNRKMAELDTQLDNDRANLEETIVNEILAKIL